MNWYKKAIKMFETYGLADKIAQSFKRHYDAWKKEQNPKTMQKQYETKQQIYLGSANISSALKTIFEKHGYPQGVNNYIPKTIHFILIHPSQINAKNTNAFFTISGNKFIIAKVESDIANVQFDEKFYGSIEHELQHFLRSLYEGKMTQAYEEEQKEIDYYLDPWEIQAFSQRFALDAVNLIKSNFEIRTQNTLPEQTKSILESLQEIKPKYFNLAVQNFKTYFKNISLPDDTRKQYLSAIVSNFDKLFDEMIRKKKNELV